MQFTLRRTTLAALAALSLAACGGSDDDATADERLIEQAIETAGDGSVDVNIEPGDDGELTIESEDGSFIVEANGELPDGFPAEVPIPNGWVVESSANMSSGDGTGWTVYFTFPGDAAAAAGELRAALGAAGFEEISAVTTADGTILGWQGNGYFVQGVVANGTDGSAPGAAITVSNATN